MNDVQLTLIVIGLVAIVRRWFPKVDGTFVAVCAILVAAIVSIVAEPCDLGADLVRGIVSGFVAFGAMTAVRYATRRFDGLCKGGMDTLPSGAP